MVLYLHTAFIFMARCLGKYSILLHAVVLSEAQGQLYLSFSHGCKNPSYNTRGFELNFNTKKC